MLARRCDGRNTDRSDTSCETGNRAFRSWAAKQDPPMSPQKERSPADSVILGS